MTPDLSDLRALHQAAWRAGDPAALAEAHALAAQRLEGAGLVDAACFEWVQARVYGLEAGAPQADAAFAALLRHGRDG